MLNALHLWFHLIFIPTHGVSLGFLLDLRWHKEMPYLNTYICTHTVRPRPFYIWCLCHHHLKDYVTTSVLLFAGMYINTGLLWFFCETVP